MTAVIEFVHDDGGRAAAGFKGETRDCAARAVAIALEIPYREAYDGINAVAERERRLGRKPSNARTGVFRVTLDRFLLPLGWVWTPTMQIGQGTTVHLRADELPDGRIIARCSRHFAAVIDGVLHDTHDTSRGGSRAVYGYWSAR